MNKRIFHMVVASILAATFPSADVWGQSQSMLTLDECLKLAHENDPYQKNAKLDVLSARAQRGEALAEYFPTVSASVMAFQFMNPLLDIGITDILGKSDAAWNIKNAYEDYAYANGLPTRYQNLKHGWGTGVSVMQPLYAGGRIINGNRLAQLGVEAAQLKSSMQGRETDEKIEGKYWTVVSLSEKRKVLDGADKLLDSLEKDLESAVSAGVMTESDRLQLKLKRSQLRASRLKLDRGMRLAKMDLFNAIGVRYSILAGNSSAEAPYVDDIILQTVSDNLMAPESYWKSEEEIAASMQESRLLDLQVEAKTLEKRMVMGSALPQVAVGGMVGYGHALKDHSLNGAMFMMVSIPISDWGKTSLKMKRYDNEVKKARNEREYLSAQLLLKARQSWVMLQTSWDSIEVARDAVALARDSYDRQLASFEAGMTTMADILKAQTEVLNAEDAYVDACMDYRRNLDSYLALVQR